MDKQFLTLEEIKVGDKVNTHQLSGIYDTYILLSNTYIDEKMSCTVGTVEYTGKKDENMLNIYNECMKKYGRRPMIWYNEYCGGNESWDHF